MRLLYAEFIRVSVHLFSVTLIDIVLHVVLEEQICCGNNSVYRSCLWETSTCSRHAHVEFSFTEASLYICLGLCKKIAVWESEPESSEFASRFKYIDDELTFFRWVCLYRTDNT